MREKFPEYSEHGYKTRAGTITHFVIHAPNEEDLRNHVEVPRIVEVDGYLTINHYDDGRPGEMFIHIGKAGSFMSVFDGWCTMFSILMQLRFPVDVLCNKLGYKKYWPYGGVTGVAGVTRCSSLEDLICKIMRHRFGTPIEEVLP